MAARAAARATIPGPDIRQHLAALLGKETVGPIRKTDEDPPRIPVIEVIAAIVGTAKTMLRSMFAALPRGATRFGQIVHTSVFVTEGSGYKWRRVTTGHKLHWCNFGIPS